MYFNCRISLFSSKWRACPRFGELWKKIRVRGLKVNGFISICTENGPLLGKSHPPNARYPPPNSFGYRGCSPSKIY